MWKMFCSTNQARDETHDRYGQIYANRHPGVLGKN